MPEMSNRFEWKNTLSFCKFTTDVCVNLKIRWWCCIDHLLFIGVATQVVIISALVVSLIFTVISFCTTMNSSMCTSHLLQLHWSNAHDIQLANNPKPIYIYCTNYMNLTFHNVQIFISLFKTSTKHTNYRCQRKIK